MIEFSEDAIEDLRAIRGAIAETNPARAAEKIDMIIDLCHLLDAFPRMGAVHDGPYRRFFKERWVVVYRPDDTGVFIHRVLDSRQDWRSRLI